MLVIPLECTIVLMPILYIYIYIYIYIYLGARDGVMFKALRYKPVGRGSIPDGVIGIFQ